MAAGRVPDPWGTGGGGEGGGEEGEGPADGISPLLKVTAPAPFNAKLDYTKVMDWSSGGEGEGEGEGEDPPELL